MLPYTICASYTGILSAARNRPEHRPRKGRGEPPEAASASSHTLSFLHHSTPGNLATGSYAPILIRPDICQLMMPLGLLLDAAASTAAISPSKRLRSGP